MSSYPKTFELKDGSSVLVRLMSEDDFEKSYRFFQNLPEEDRLFLRVDVTDKDVLKRRLRKEDCYMEDCVRLVAEHEDEIVADATLYRPSHGWTSHTGGIRYIIAKEYRNKGLASLLARELFVVAVKEGIEKLEAEVMEDNIAGLRSIEKLGFKKEGVLKEFVTDIKGDKHNLVIMSYFV